MIQFFLNNIQLLIFLLILAGPILGKLGEWFLKQKAARDQQAEMRRREEEELRTGRISEPAAKQPSPEELEAMIAEQLRQQREEMMRQRAEQAEARRKAAQERAEAARKKQEQGKQQVQRSTRRERANPAQQRSATTASGTTVEPVSLAGIVPASRRAPTTPAQSERGAALVGDIDAESLRKAIVMNEILSPPISIRKEGESLF